MKYSDLNLEISSFTNSFTIGENEIQVSQYLPIEDKYDLISAVLQKSEENGVYNPLLADMYFNLYLIYMYTDLTFTLDEKAEPNILYDELESNGIIQSVIQNMNPYEYKYLTAIMKKQIALRQTYNRTMASVFHDMMDTLPDKAEKAADILKNFKPEDFQQVINFAIAANGGRPIN